VASALWQCGTFGGGKEARGCVKDEIGSKSANFAHTRRVDLAAVPSLTEMPLTRRARAAGTRGLVDELIAVFARACALGRPWL
jgi:hypothetical protein